MSEQKYDIIIVGAGTAGLTAAIYARRAEKRVLVLEALTYGGQIINTLDIANYPVAPHISGPDFAKQLYGQAQELGAEVKFEKVLAVRVAEGGGSAEASEGDGARAVDAAKTADAAGSAKTLPLLEVQTAKQTYTAGAVILATGSADRQLGLPREEELTGHGVSYCATCDGGFYKHKDVAVAGGGNTALYDALYLADIARRVYVVHRRAEFRGDAALVRRLQQRPNVQLIMEANVTALQGGQQLEAIEITHVDGEKQILPVAGLFVAAGRAPANAPYRDLVTLDGGGYVEAGEDCHTNVPGVFVAGDNRAKAVRQLVTATADGAVAASEAVRYLTNFAK